MLLQNLRARIGARLKGDSEAGFTLIELLVVMLILGILAAIAIPAFFNQKDKATDASAKSMVRSAETAVETWSTDHGGVYSVDGTPPTGEELHKIEPTVQSSVTVTSEDPKEYTVTAESSLGHEFSITRKKDGETELTCEPAGEGGCPPAATPGGKGNWGE